MEWGGRTTYTRRSGLKGLKQSASPPARRLKDQSVNREKKNYPETQLQPIAYQLDVHACGMQACQMQDAEDHALSSPAHTKLMARFMFERTTGANQAVHCKPRVHCVRPHRQPRRADKGCGSCAAHLPRVAIEEKAICEDDAGGFAEEWMLPGYCAIQHVAHLPRRLSTSAANAEGVSLPACRQAQWQSGHRGLRSGEKQPVGSLFPSTCPRKCSTLATPWAHSMCYRSLQLGSAAGAQHEMRGAGRMRGQ